MNYSKRVTALSPSATFAMAQRSTELKAEGIDIINMSVGEPDFNTPEHIVGTEMVPTALWIKTKYFKQHELLKTRNSPFAISYFRYGPKKY